MLKGRAPYAPFSARPSFQTPRLSRPESAWVRKGSQQQRLDGRAAPYRSVVESGTLVQVPSTSLIRTTLNATSTSLAALLGTTNVSCSRYTQEAGRRDAAAPQNNELPKQIEPYVESVGFAHSDEAIVVRNSRHQISVFTAPQSPPLRFELYEALQKNPVRPRFGRPLMAAIKMGQSWRIAWVSPDGVVVADLHEGTFGQPVRFPPLLPASSLDAISRLEFSDDGNFLAGISQAGFQEPMTYRVWDVGFERKRLIDSLNEDGLVKEGCAVAKLESGSNQFSDQETQLILRERFFQPCKE
jgi:hypothetical protein